MTLKGYMVRGEQWEWLLVRETRPAEKGQKNWSYSRRGGKEERRQAWGVKEVSTRRRRAEAGSFLHCSEKDSAQTSGRTFQLYEVFVRLSKEMELSVCQKSLHPFQPAVGFSDLVPVTLSSRTWLHSLSHSWCCTFKDSSSDSFSSVDAYA